MAQPVTIYRWDDPGAPQLTQTAGSAVDVLKKCLIDGYGTKTPAGWVLEEISTDNNNMIFSPASRTWLYLIYDDGRNSYWGEQSASFGAIDAYNSIENPMSSLNYDSWTTRPSSDKGFYNQTLDKSASQWVIIATNESCYFLQGNLGTSGISTACFIGKLDSNGHDLSYTAIGNYGRYKDWEVGQFLTNYKGASAFLRRSSSFPILVDINTGILDSISSIGPVDYNNSQLPKSSSFSEEGMWGPLFANNNSGVLSAIFPNIEIALASPQVWPARFAVIGNYLYFNRARFYVGE